MKENIKLENIYDKIRSNEQISDNEKKAILLDTYLFLESENFHTNIKILEEITNINMTDLEKQIELIY